MTGEEDAGSQMTRAKKMILSSLKRSHGLRPREMEHYLTINADGTKGEIARSTFHRALKELVAEKKIVRKQTEGKKEIIYHVPGREPTLNFREEPSGFDELVVEECKKALSRLMDNGLVLYTPMEDEFPFEFDSPPIDECELKRTNDLFASVFQLVDLWERMRGTKIVRHWGEDVEETFFIFGADYHTAAHNQSNVGRFARIDEWFTFYSTAIDTISHYISQYRGVAKQARGRKVEL